MHTFDPHPDNNSRLKENIQENGFTNVVVNQQAVSEHSGISRFNFGNSSKVASLKQLAGQRSNWHEVPTISLDSYWEQAGKPDIRLVKIDVEGAEDLVLKGMLHILAEMRPLIVLELHRFAFTEEQEHKLLSLLFRRSYVAQVLFIMDAGSKYRNVPKHNLIRRYSTLDELDKGAHTVGLFLQNDKAQNINSEVPQ